MLLPFSYFSTVGLVNVFRLVFITSMTFDTLYYIERLVTQLFPLLEVSSTHV